MRFCQQIKCQIAAIIVTAQVFLLIVYAILMKILLLSNIQNNFYYSLQNTLHQTEGIVIDLASNENLESIQKVIADLGSDFNNQRSHLLNEDKTILASTHLNQIGNKFEEVKLQPEISIGVDGYLIHGQVKVCENTPKVFKPTGCGYLFIEQNLKYTVSDRMGFFYKNLILVAIASFSLTFSIFKLLHHKINVRVENLIENLKDQKKTEITGEDEISTLANEYNKILLNLEEIAKKEAKEAKLLDSVLESVKEAIIATNSNGNIKVYNQSAERIFGFSKNEILGKKIETLIQEKNFFSNKENYRQERKVTALDSAKRETPLLVFLEEIPSKDPLELSMVAVFKDLTEVNSMNKAISKLDYLEKKHEFTKKTLQQIEEGMQHNVDVTKLIPLVKDLKSKFKD